MLGEVAVYAARMLGLLQLAMLLVLASAADTVLVPALLVLLLGLMLLVLLVLVLLAMLESWCYRHCDVCIIIMHHSSIIADNMIGVRKIDTNWCTSARRNLHLDMAIKSH